MIPSTALFERGPVLLGADTTTLALAANLKLGLIMAPFTPSPGLLFASLTLATFDGYTPLVPTPGTQPESLDPSNGDAIIDLADPVGGWRWETTGVTNLPQTIYGFLLYNSSTSLLYASELLPDPITLTAINQAIVLNRPTLRFAASGVS